MDISLSALIGQILVGLINGSALAMLSLGLAIIFGLLNIINVTHGAQYMMGAFCAWMLLNYFGIGYWPSLIIAPIIVGAPASCSNASSCGASTSSTTSTASC